MKRVVSLLCVVAVLGLASAVAQAAVQSFDGTVPLGDGGWYVDRYAPAGFLGGQTAPDGRTGTLKQSISGSDFQQSGFYNTQGRKYDTTGSTSLFVELYIPSDWSSLIAGTSGRLASLWATGLDSSGVISAYPIIEFNNSVNGFRVWDSNAPGGWVNVSGFTGYGKWYDIGFTNATGGVDTFYVNGGSVKTIVNADTIQFDNVMLQGYNSGTSYDIYWDNLRTAGEVSAVGNAPVPEPATIAIWSLLGGLGICVGWLRKRTAA